MGRPGHHTRVIKTKKGRRLKVINPRLPLISDRRATITMWKIIDKALTGEQTTEFHIGQTNYYLRFKKWAELTHIPTQRERIAYLENQTYYHILPKWKGLPGYVVVEKGFKQEAPSGITFLLMRKIQ